jgi:hypothetical protein
MTVKTKLRLIFALFFALLGGLTYYGSSGLKLLEGELVHVANYIALPVAPTKLQAAAPAVAGA